jgi:hypothetical protein
MTVAAASGLPSTMSTVKERYVEAVATEAAPGTTESIDGVIHHKHGSVNNSAKRWLP